MFAVVLLTKNAGNSVIKLMKDLFPEVKWIPWRFESAPHAFWSRLKNRRYKLQPHYQKTITLISQTSNIQQQQQQKSNYNNNQSNNNRKCFEFPLVLFVSVFLFFFCFGNQLLREFLEAMGEEHGFKTYQDYYQMKYEHFVESGTTEKIRRL